MIKEPLINSDTRSSRLLLPHEHTPPLDLPPWEGRARRLAHTVQNQWRSASPRINQRLLRSLFVTVALLASVKGEAREAKGWKRLLRQVEQSVVPNRDDFRATEAEIDAYVVWEESLIAEVQLSQPEEAKLDRFRAQQRERGRRAIEARKAFGQIFGEGWITPQEIQQLIREVR